MKLFAATGCIVAVTATAIYAQLPRHSGVARVIDGDTIVIGEKHIRIFGIDSPESYQTCSDEHGVRWLCGEVATQAMKREIGNKPVTCDQKDTDRYGRIVAICFVDGRDIGRSMVLHGWAVDYARYSEGLYAKEQETARAKKHGIWNSHFEQPEQWRREHRERQW